MSLRSRIAAAAGVAVALVVIVMAAFVYLAVRSELRGQVDDSLQDRAGQVASLPIPRTQEGGRLIAPPPGAAERFRRLERLRPSEPFGGAGGYAQLLTADGTIIRPPGDATLPVTADARAIARRGDGSSLTDMQIDGTHLRVYTRALDAGGAVQVARPLDEIDAQLQRILTALIVIGLAGVGAGAALGAWVARTALVPIGRFTARTEALSADPDLSQRIEVVGNDELARMARSFNANLDALERSAQAQRQLVADASHELRTPIASLRANLQLLGDAERLPPDELKRMGDDIVGEVDELTALVADIVELARGSKPPDDLDDVRLDAVVSAIVEREGHRAGDRAQLHAQLEPTLIRGEPERIGRAVANLVGNAIKWSPPGDSVEIELAGGVLSVRDHGPGFDESDLPHIFERFYRAATARGTSGSGLGLAIVQHAVEAHGGFVEAANAPGGGALLRAGFGPPLPLPEPLGPITSPSGKLGQVAS
jgi:two-component system sensor histidine kinase MprB